MSNYIEFDAKPSEAFIELALMKANIYRNEEDGKFFDDDSGELVKVPAFDTIGEVIEWIAVYSYEKGKYHS